jgi:hypothetical protein
MGPGNKKYANKNTNKNPQAEACEFWNVKMFKLWTKNRREHLKQPPKTIPGI